MNNRFIELAKQAEIQVDYFGLGSCADGGNPDIEKFAELIVQECIQKIGDLMDCTDYPDGTEKSIVELKALRDVRQVVKEHFGVKE